MKSQTTIDALQELSPSLASCVTSARPVSEPAAEQAQQRLLTRLAAGTDALARPSLRSIRPRWLALAASAVLALALSIAVPLNMREGSAFAAVQAHFLRFQHLRMEVEQRMQGKVVQRSTSIISSDGVVRTDIGEQLSVIVDPPRGRLLLLMHEPRTAVVSALPKSSSQPTQNDVAGAPELRWLDEIRRFQGKAERIPQTRVIDGQTAQAWRLLAGGNELLLWANADNLPLRMEVKGGSPLELEFRFQFNQPQSAALLSSDVPAGYEVQAADTD